MFSIPFTVERSVEISKQPEDVFADIADFQTWRQWSPWLIQEPDCKLDISNTAGQIGHSQSWDGKNIGSGSMELKSFNAPSSLQYDLHFLKPWKSHSKVEFKISPSGAGSKVTWSMQGSMPFFLFFMKKMMSAWVGSDYERGLTMLKEYSESGNVQSKVNFDGEIDQSEFFFVGRRNKVATKELGPAMRKDFDALDELASSGKLPKPEFALSLYHNYDMVNGTCDYTSGFAYKKQPEVNESSLHNGKIAPHHAIKVSHVGPYHHLGNGWATAMSWQRSLKKKVAKQLPMYEVYVNMPGQVADEQLKTDIYIPVR